MLVILRHALRSSACLGSSLSPALAVTQTMRAHCLSHTSQHRQSSSSHRQQYFTPWHIRPTARPLNGWTSRSDDRDRGPVCRASSTASAGLFPAPGSQQGDQQGAMSFEFSAQERAQMRRELHSLNVAISANVLIAVAKVWVHILSGSSAMLAEAFHSVADILNQVLLRVGVVKAMKAPTASHPYGYLRDRFVWSLISAVGIFFLGAGASVFHGLHTLTETRVVEAAWASYLVLGISGLLEGYSLYVAARYVFAGAKARGMNLLQYIRSGVDPTTVAVMLEDGGAVAGLAIAAVCTALTHATGNAVWDALGSIAVGGLLGLIATFLVQKNRDLLLGRSMSERETKEVLEHLRRDPVVLYVTSTKTEEIGPRVFRFTADVAWNADKLVERYVERVGRQAVVERLQAALDADRIAAVRATNGASGGCASGGVGNGVGQQPSELDKVLKAYGREIISAVGAEVDRIELELQNVNPGIRWVDLETDRGSRATWGRSPTDSMDQGSPGPSFVEDSMTTSSSSGADGALQAPLSSDSGSQQLGSSSSAQQPVTVSATHRAGAIANRSGDW